MSKYTIFLKHVAQDIPDIKRWCLDYPRNEDNVEVVELETSEIIFQGWLLKALPCDAQLFLEQNQQRTLLALDRKRPDVIKAILASNADDHPQLVCGFRRSVTLSSPEFCFGVSVNGLDYPLVYGQIKGAFKVLQGLEGWLFLDNDTNNSVEQYTGKLLLGRDQKLAWQHYFSGANKLAHSLNIPYAMLMAPSKEAVYSQFYPYNKAKITPIEQLMRLLPENFPLVYPVEELANSEHRSFRVTDSHWSIHGAALASFLVAEKLGIPKDSFNTIFRNDTFYGKVNIGDLGNKVFPPASHSEDLLANYSYRNKVVYDNLLANFGRCIVLANSQACINGTLLIFGSSSAYSMFNYLSRIFSLVIMIHSAGNIDVELANEIQPDFILLQTNARFVVRAPNLDYCLQQSISEKLASLSNEQRAIQFQEVQKFVQGDLKVVRVLHAKYSV